MSMNKKVSDGQMSKIFQSGKFFGFLLDKVDKKIVINLATPLSKNDFPGLVKQAIYLQTQLWTQ